MPAPGCLHKPSHFRASDEHGGQGRCPRSAGCPASLHGGKRFVPRHGRAAQTGAVGCHSRFPQIFPFLWAGLFAPSFQAAGTVGLLTGDHRHQESTQRGVEGEIGALWAPLPPVQRVPSHGLLLWRTWERGLAWGERMHPGKRYKDLVMLEPKEQP